MSSALVNSRTSWMWAGAATVAMSVLGCAQDTMDDAASIAQAIEKDNGGLTMDDELEADFGDATFADQGMPDEERPAADDLETDPAVMDIERTPDRARYFLRMMWGRMPVDADARTPRNWSGQISVSRGAVLLRSTIAFDALDRLLPRTNPRSIEFRSVTMPARDGLSLVVLDGTPDAAEPLVVTYTTTEGDEYSATIHELLEGPKHKVVDADARLGIVAVAMDEPVDVCNHGFLGGRWHQVAENRGRIWGRVVNARGERLGRVRGVYGQRRNGDKVFFGKYINSEGKFRGIFRGTYGEGHFEGRWLTRAGEVGRLGGEYRRSERADRVGGHFLGRWAETSCDVRVGPSDRPTTDERQ